MYPGQYNPSSGGYPAPSPIYYVPSPNAKPQLLVPIRAQQSPVSQPYYYPPQIAQQQVQQVQPAQQVQPIQQVQHTKKEQSFEKMREQNMNSEKALEILKERKKTAVEETTTLKFTLNGQEVEIENPDPTAHFLDWVRGQPNLTGTKRSCSEGGCGACTVNLTFQNSVGQTIDISANSCLLPICYIEGISITTVEGVGSSRDGFNVIQKSIAESNGSQCGFCTPGMVVNFYSLTKIEPKPAPIDIQNHLDGNICRCTGYRPILAGMNAAAGNTQYASPKDIEDILQPKKNCKPKCYKRKIKKGILPSARLFKNGKYYWYQVASLEEAFVIKQDNPNGQFISSGTSLGVYPYYGVEFRPNVYIEIGKIPELLTTTINSDGVKIGAGVSITDTMNFLTQVASDYPTQAKFFPVLVDHLRRIGGTNIRNIGTLAGNCMIAYNTENFPSDVVTTWMGADATATIYSSVSNKTTIAMSDFFSFNMQDKILVSFFIPFSVGSGQYLDTFRVAIRHFNSAPLVNSAFNVVLDSNLKFKSQPILVFGGIAIHNMRASKTEKYLIGKSATDLSVLQGACSLLQQELVPVQANGKQAYRQAVAISFFYKFFLELQPTLPSNLYTATHPFIRPASTGIQNYATDPDEYPVSEAIPKTTALIQASGEAKYTDDIPSTKNTLYGAFVTTTQGNADITAIDVTAALKCAGVVDFVSAADVPGENIFNSFPDGVPHKYLEEIFSTEKSLYYGQSVGLIVADTHENALYAATKVKITYANPQTPILTIQEAIDNKSYSPFTFPDFNYGDIKSGFQQSPNIITGSVSMGHQYHFHMETQTCYIIPEEDGTWTANVATQWPTVTQSVIATALGIQYNHVNVKTKRVGGAFGAKIIGSNIISAASAVAANKLNCPIKTVLPIDTNMSIIGKRSPFLCNYKIGFDNNGIIFAVEANYYDDGGGLLDSAGVDGTLPVVFLSFDNTYNFPNIKLTGKVVKTDTPANMAMRAPGFVEGIFYAEQWLEHVARYLNLDPVIVKQRNFYKQGNVTPYGVPLTYWNIPSLWQQIQQTADYQNRVSQVNAYNSANSWTKQGISLVPVKYGISQVGAPFGCFVNIYGDGTVVVNHSGIEMGQGIDTKVLQVASYALGIPMSMITVTTTTTNKVPNASCTAGSIGSSLNPQIVLDACKQMMNKLAPFQDKITKTNDPVSDWQNLINEALGNGVYLQTTGYVFEQPPANGNIFDYNSYGVACSQVILDVLTGELQILRTDILFDCGQSLNPAIDIGQVEGAFVMGVGYWTTEEFIFNSNGSIQTNGSWGYKPPSVGDIPIDFRVTLVKEAPVPAAVLNSKATGEPPLGLSPSVFFAAINAINAARSDLGLPPQNTVSPPLTVDVVQQAIGYTINNYSI